MKKPFVAKSVESCSLKKLDTHIIVTHVDERSVHEGGWRSVPHAMQVWRLVLAGAKNHNFKDGLSNYRVNFYRDNPQQRFCEICGGDQHLVIHHLDRNRKNNNPENLVMVCRSCHAKVHGLASNLGEIPMVERED